MSNILHPNATTMPRIREEIGVLHNKVKIISQYPAWLSYNLPEDLISKVWNGKYRGQSQKWFLMRFLGVDKDINIATENPEFMAWKWVTPESLIDLIVPFKRDVYKQIIEGFVRLPQPA